MKNRVRQILATIAMSVMGTCLGAQTGERWIFEGLITESDPSLAPQLQSGWVLAGSFLMNTLEMEEQFVDEETRSGRITGGITEAEMTVDLYYQVLFQAAQQPGLIGFDFQDNNPEENGRDLFGWFFPLKGKLADTEWVSTWLQIWLMDPDGKMIRYSPVKISPYGIKWKSGWFRLTFANEKGETAHADGRIELFSPESNVDEMDRSPWQAAAADLSRQLMERDSTISLLQSELTEAKSRLDGLRRMVDLLVEERANLQEDNELLKKRAEAADPKILEKLAEITAEKSLLESRINDLSGENDLLQLRLGKSEQERHQLLQNIENLQNQRPKQELPVFNEPPESDPVESVIPQPVLLPPMPEPLPPIPEPEPVVPATAPPENEPVTKEQPLEEPANEMQREEQTAVPDTDEQDREKVRSTRRWGPRKFR